MEKLKWIVVVVDGLVALACATLGFLWALEYIHISFLPPNEGAIQATSWSEWNVWRWIGMLGCAWLILVNVVVVGARWFSSKYDTHVRCKTPDGEVSITVYALEETLARLVGTLPEIAGITVTVRKEKLQLDKPVLVVASVKAYEGISLKEITERVKEVILHRYQEIIESHVKPTIEICVYKLVERQPRKEPAPKKTRKEVPSEEIFRGPVYPMDEEERT